MTARKTKILFALTGAAIVLALVIGIDQAIVLHKAHSTFDNYYAFRGCVQLLEKTDTYGVCRTNSGEIITIVEYQNKWYLAGDLPWGCLGGICFGI